MLHLQASENASRTCSLELIESIKIHTDLEMQKPFLTEDEKTANLHPPRMQKPAFQPLDIHYVLSFSLFAQELRNALQPAVHIQPLAGHPKSWHKLMK